MATRTSTTTISGASEPLMGDANNRTFWRFAFRLTLFWLPILVVGVFGLEAVLWRSGETWSIKRVLQYQTARPDAVFMRKYIGQDLYSYKWSALIQNRPEVVVLGSSRVMKIRAEMLGLKSSPGMSAAFYNCGGMVQSLEDLGTALELLPSDYRPKVAIIGLDLWWFNENYHQTARLREDAQTDAALDWRQHLKCLRQLFKSRKDIQEAWRAHISTTQNHWLGLGAVAGKGTGFRRDGSLSNNQGDLPIQNGQWVYMDTERPPVKERVTNKNRQFVPANRLSPASLKMLETCLVEFRRRGTIVIAILPPFSEEVAALLAASPDQQGIWRSYQTDLPELLQRFDVPFVNAATPANLGLDDRYLMDGFHGGETFHLHLLRRLLKDSRVAALFPKAVVTIDAALASPKTNFWIPDLQ